MDVNVYVTDRNIKIDTVTVILTEKEARKLCHIIGHTMLTHPWYRQWSEEAHDLMEKLVTQLPKPGSY